MKPYEFKEESLQETLDSVVSQQRWQVEYMRNALFHLGEGKRIVRLLMEHYVDGKKKEDQFSEDMWIKLDESDCRLLESMIALSESISKVVSEGLVIKYSNH